MYSRLTQMCQSVSLSRRWEQKITTLCFTCEQWIILAGRISNLYITVQVPTHCVKQKKRAQLQTLWNYWQATLHSHLTLFVVFYLENKKKADVTGMDQSYLHISIQRRILSGKYHLVPVTVNLKGWHFAETINNHTGGNLLKNRHTEQFLHLLCFRRRTSTGSIFERICNILQL